MILFTESTDVNDLNYRLVKLFVCIVHRSLRSRDIYYNVPGAAITTVDSVELHQESQVLDTRVVDRIAANHVWSWYHILLFVAGAAAYVDGTCVRSYLISAFIFWNGDICFRRDKFGMYS